MTKMEGRRARIKQVIDAEAVAPHNLEYKRLKEFTLNRRRSELDIIALILNISMDGVKKSRIFLDANISYTMFRKYLYYMVGIEFLREKRGLYYTTKKGAKFLGHWNQIISLF